MTLPAKKGLSSSAAICVLTARAFNRIYGLNLTVRGEMEAAYHGEQLTPSRCGRLDQSCAYGKGILHLKFNGEKLDIQPIQVGAPLHFVFADLKAKKDTMTILRDLNAAYPYPQSDLHKGLHELLGKMNEQTVGGALCAMAEGDAEAVGNLMKDAQARFDQYAAPLSPDELKAEKLHNILDDPSVAQWVFGGKGVGSQGDGTVQFVAKSAECQEKLRDYLNEQGLDAYSATIPKTKAVRKAVIPLAGYGSRMYPATKIIKKEFFPVIDTDGYAKPVLLIILDELVEAGIDEICLIIKPGEQDLYLSLFNKLGESQQGKLPGSLRAYEHKLSSLKDKIAFAYQDEMLGFGHAVLQSAGFASDEPVLLMLGDHLFRSGGGVNCASQLIAAYEKTEKLTIGLFEIAPEDAPKYGVVKGSFVEGGNRLAKLESLTEKPSAEFAAKHLGLSGDQYAVFMYVLTPEVFKALGDEFKDGKTEFGEYQLTPSLDSVAGSHGAYGLVINGERFDVGIPGKYRETVANFGRFEA